MLDSLRRGKRADPAIAAVEEPAYGKDVALDVGYGVDTRSDAAKYWTVAVCGIALLSDGYCASSIGTVISIIKTLYPKEAAESKAFSILSSISFVGTVVGQLTFGYICDRIGRKYGMIIATCLLIFWTAMCAGAYGLHGSILGMMAALATYRTFLGFAIGAEYPVSSAAASETSAETKSGHRHAIFVGVTNVAIDLGFVLGAFVPYILVLIFTDKHLRIIWRLIIGLGIVIPSSLFYFRVKMTEPKAYQKAGGRRAKIPYWLVIKRYWVRLAAISIIWFIYDFSAYAFGIYSSTITNAVLPAGSSYAKQFGWATLINVFYLPGAFLGAFGSDFLGPKYCLMIGIFLQAIVGFFMAGFYNHILASGIGGFVVMYGVFLSLGEFGPGDNIGLIAAKSSSSMVRGQFYGIAAAIGKVGAFAGSYAFTKIAARFDPKNPDSASAYAGDFYVASALAIVAGIIAFFFVGDLDQECIQKEDVAFMEYLERKTKSLHGNLPFYRHMLIPIYR